VSPGDRGTGQASLCGFVNRHETLAISSWPLADRRSGRLTRDCAEVHWGR